MNDTNISLIQGEIAELLRPILKDKADICEKQLLDKYNNLETVFSMDIEELSEVVGARAAGCISLLARITSRRLTEGFEFGKRHTECELIDYLKALFIGLSVEHLYLVSIGRGGEITAVDLISVGTVNSAAVVPRNIIETALKRRADSIILAHNHPRGRAEPSIEDNRIISSLIKVCAKSGIRLSGHIIIAGNKYSLTTLQGDM